MRPLSWLLRLGLVVGAGALLVTALVVAVAPRVWQAANAHEELPVTLPEFAPLARRSYVYDRNGGLLAIYELENSQPISLEEIPKRVTKAFLAVEDKEFYIHDGVNVRSLIRATLSNFASDAPQQGASTITMQVVKNEFLAGLDRDGRYKLLQIHYARMLEKEKTKDEILERYLNTVFFGNNAYGIQAASETYFGKTTEELTFIESAFLAGLVRSPSGYDPINEPERSRARFVQVLDRLVEDGLVKQRVANRLERNFVLPEQVRTLESQKTTRTYYTEALRDYLLNRSDILGATYEERYSAMYRGGLRIYTTFDPALQLKAEAAHAILPENALGVDSAMVSLDSQTGAIRAMVGGDGFEAGQSEVNMALSPRQTGSSIKFFILAAALQAGAQADDLVMGEENCVIPNPDNPLEPLEIDGVVGHGLVTLDEHTWSSANCAYSRLAQIVGLHRMVDTLYRMAKSPYLVKGKDADDPLRNEELKPYASFATGGNEMSAARHGGRRPVDRQRWRPPRPVLRRACRVGGRHGDVQALQRRHAGARPQSRAEDDRRAETRAHESQRDGTPLPARWPSRRRQDRDTGQQHQRLVRRVHTATHHGRVGRKSQRIRADGQYPRVQPVRGRRRGPGWAHPGDVVEGLHGSCPRRSSRRGLVAHRRRPHGHRCGCSCRVWSAPSGSSATTTWCSATPTHRASRTARRRRSRRDSTDRPDSSRQRLVRREPPRPASRLARSPVSRPPTARARRNRTSPGSRARPPTYHDRPRHLRHRRRTCRSTRT